MPFTLEHIRIAGLYGDRDISIPIVGNKLILVGENGSGKSTILNIVFYLLTRQVTELLAYEFESVSVTVSGETYAISQEDLEAFTRVRPVSLRRDSEWRGALDQLLEEHDIDPEAVRRDPEIAEALSERLGVPAGWVRRHTMRVSTSRPAARKGANSVKKTLSALTTAIDAKILYLPTYRRIERELRHIFGDDQEALARQERRQKRRRRARQHVELVQFGMSDVTALFSDVAGELDRLVRARLQRLAVGYFSDVLAGRHQTADLSTLKTVSRDGIQSMISRVGDDMLGQTEKSTLRKYFRDISKRLPTDESGKIIAFFLVRLIEVHEEQQQFESRVLTFRDTCNRYLQRKYVHYDTSTFELSVRHSPKPARSRSPEPAPGQEEPPGRLKLHMLSSGEKQIVSLFAHMHLSGGGDYFVIIDEPELSLSVPWQKTFLSDITSGGSCTGLMAVTHSPFVYENELDSFTHGINEFTTWRP